MQFHDRKTPKTARNYPMHENEETPNEATKEEKSRDTDWNDASRLHKVPPAGLEPATHGVETHCSNPLSYGGWTDHLY